VSKLLTTPTDPGAADWEEAVLASNPGGIYEADLVLFVGPGHPRAADDADLDTPFVSIQAALDAIGVPVDLADQKRRFTVLLAPGEYDEDLTLPSGRRITLFPLGPVTLGDGAVDANFTSTTPRSITLDMTPAFGGRSVFVIGTYNPSLLYGGNCTQAGAFDISGNVVLVGTPTVAAAGVLRLSMTRIRGDLDGSALAALGVDTHINQCRIDGNITNGNSAVINMNETAVLGTITLLIIVTAVNCQFEDDVTVALVSTGAGVDTLPPGFYGCRFDGAGPPTFTGPAGSAMFDATTNYWFKTNGWGLAGGATKVILSDATP
jgi:hypothetical protein